MSTSAKRRRSLLAKVHIAKAQLQMDEGDYRDVLERVTGCRSAADCTGLQLETMLAECRRLGFVEAPPKKTGRAPKGTPATAALLSKVGALLADAKRPWSYAHATAAKMFKVERIEWLQAGQLRKLVAALQIDQNRQRSAGGNTQ